MNRIIKEFWKRRKYRLSDRGIRLDSKKGHGNTKLPFGLCKKEGIEIKPDWTPKDAWDALKGKGYDPGEEYKKLGGEKKEEPKIEEKPKNSLNYMGDTYNDLLVNLDYGSCSLYGENSRGEKTRILGFMTKGDMYIFLNENGIKSIKTNEGKEIKIDNIPKHDFKIADQWYTNPEIKRFAGEYVFMAKNMDGGIEKISFSPNLIYLKKTAEDVGAKNIEYDEEIKKELNEYENKFKKGNGECFENEGRLWSDISISIRSFRAKDINGEEKAFSFKDKYEMYKFLKENGVKKIKDYDGMKDISDVEIKEKIGESESENLYSFNTKVEQDPLGNKYIKVEMDLGGDRRANIECKSSKKINEILSKYGLDMNSKGINIEEDVLKELKKLDKVEEEKEHRKEERLKKEESRRLEKEKPEYSKMRIPGGDVYVKDIKVIGNVSDGYGIIGIDDLGRTVEIKEKKYPYDIIMDKLDDEGIENYKFGDASTDSDSGYVDGKKITDIKIKFKQSTEQYYISGDEEGGFWSSFTSKESFDTEEEAAKFLQDNGINSYRSVDGTKITKENNFTEKDPPAFGMTHIKILKKGKDYYVIANTKRFGKRAEMFKASSEEECRKWIEEKGANKEVNLVREVPNSNVSRPHIGKSIEKFDDRRIEFIESSSYGAANLDNLNDEEQEKATEMLTELFSKGSFRMARGSSRFFSILQDWRFKNQFETGSSSGLLSLDRRTGVAKKLFGASEMLPGKDREKYGYLGIDNTAEDMNSNKAYWYGDIKIKFKKDSLKDRATYTFGDSLDESSPCAGYAGDKPTIEGMSTTASYVIRDLLDEYEKYKKGEINYNDLYESAHRICGIGYVECQYHDDLTMDDVDEITAKSKKELRATFFGRDKEESKKILKRMKDSGIKFYYAEGTQKTGRTLKDAYEYLEKNLIDI